MSYYAQKILRLKEWAALVLSSADYLAPLSETEAAAIHRLGQALHLLEECAAELSSLRTGDLGGIYAEDTEDLLPVFDDEEPEVEMYRLAKAREDKK